MQYYVIATSNDATIKSKAFSTLSEAQKAQKELTNVAQNNGFDLTCRVIVEGLFYDYQNALMTLPSNIPEKDPDEWMQIYNEMKKFLLIDAKCDFQLGNMTAEEYDKLIKIANALREE